MVRLLGIGDNTVDIYLTEEMQYPGGNAVNVAVHARRNGAEASYLGCLGQDILGDLVFESLASEGVDVSRVRRIKGPNPWSRIRHQNGDRIFIGSNPGVRDRYDLTADDLAFIITHDLVHTTVHSGSMRRSRRSGRSRVYCPTTIPSIGNGPASPRQCHRSILRSFLARLAVRGNAYRWPDGVPRRGRIWSSSHAGETEHSFWRMAC